MRVFPPIDRQAQIRERAGELESLYHSKDCKIILWHQGKVAVNNQQLKFYSADELVDYKLVLSSPLYLGTHDQISYFSQQLDQLGGRFENLELENLRTASFFLDDQELGLLFYAQGLFNWHQTHGYCGKCGQKTKFESAGHSRVCENSSCGKTHFPRIEPAVIFSIINNEESESKILLARQGSWDENRYSVLAGFVESGETLEHAVEREAIEEVGIQVNSVNYIASQPWPFPSSLMLGFECITEEFDIQLNDDEIEKATWVTAGELETLYKEKQLKLPFSVSISRHLIDRWYRSQTGRPLKSLKS